MAGLGVVALALPLTWRASGCRPALFALAAMIAAFGLTLLVGVAGQLSLGHAFFLAIGAYGYAFFAGAESPGPGRRDQGSAYRRSSPSSWPC